MGKLHRTWDVRSLRSMLGRALDLQAAYKQPPLAPEASWYSWLAVFNPHTQLPELFRSLVLPFGAAASVREFNRLP